MTEIPEHLLKRSRERRAAVTGEGGDSGSASGASNPPADRPSTEVVPAAASTEVAAVAVEPEAPKPLPPYIEYAQRRTKVPIWALPVLAVLPVWGFMYVRALTDTDESAGVLAEGEALYAQNCSACHGGSGGGGVGYQLNDGEVLATFPTLSSHLDWVRIGTEGVGAGNPYGSADRPGGQRIAGGQNRQMPAFGDSLTPEEIYAIVRYEREVLSEEEIAPADLVVLDEGFDAWEASELNTGDTATGEAGAGGEGGETADPAG